MSPEEARSTMPSERVHVLRSIIHLNADRFAVVSGVIR